MTKKIPFPAASASASALAIAIARLAVCGVVFFAIPSVWAQASNAAESAAAPVLDIGAERLRIAAEQARLAQVFNTLDRSCYEKFLVNRCLDQFKTQRREALSDLKRQELVINEQARQAKGEQALRKIAERSSPEALQEQADKRAASVKEFDQRMAREKEKNSQRASAAVEAKNNLAEQAKRAQQNQDKAEARSARQAQADEALKKTQDRQAQAAQRQAQSAKDQLERTKPPAAGLPTPP